MASTGKIVEVLFEKTKETYEHQDMMLDLVNYEQPEAGSMQNSGNIIWRPTQQHAPIIDDWDLTGKETDIIEETYPAILGTPKNDFIKQRADDMRDLRFWERRGEQSGKRQATELNKQIAETIALQGSKFYRSDAVSGYDFIAEAQAILNETQQNSMMDRSFMLNDRSTLKFASDLAGRQTVQGRPEDTWKTGQIGSNVAEFDIYTGSFLPNLIGGATPTATVTADVSEKPEAGSVSSTGVVTNIDYRLGTIAVSASAAYNVGDKIKFANGGADVQSVGLADKTETGQAMTFTVVGKPDATTLEIFPKPIAVNDAALTDLEKAYGNINTQILSGATVERLNIDATAKTNLFWDKDAIEVIGGTIPAELFQQFDGMKVVNSTMKNGQTLYMVYDGQIEDMSLRYRIFTWYGITMANPQNAGVAVSF